MRGTTEYPLHSEICDEQNGVSTLLIKRSGCKIKQSYVLASVYKKAARECSLMYEAKRDQENKMRCERIALVNKLRELDAEIYKTPGEVDLESVDSILYDLFGIVSLESPVQYDPDATYLEVEDYIKITE